MHKFRGLSSRGWSPCFLPVGSLAWLHFTLGSLPPLPSFILLCRFDWNVALDRADDKRIPGSPFLICNVGSTESQTSKRVLAGKYKEEADWNSLEGLHWVCKSARILLQVMLNLGLCDAALSNPALISYLLLLWSSPQSAFTPWNLAFFPFCLTAPRMCKISIRFRLLEGTNPSEFMSALNYFLQNSHDTNLASK